jgi:plasmid stabilization system protein ParE
MRVRLTSAAEAELAEALEWYGTNAPGAAVRFLGEFERLLGHLAESLRQFPVIDGEVRRAGFRRFPYGLIFRIGAEQVEVFACFHARRDPRHWRTRA